MSVEIIEAGREVVEIHNREASREVVEILAETTTSVDVEGGSRTVVVEVLSDGDREVIEVEVPGRRGPEGAQGPSWEPDLPTLSLIFENGLI